MFHPKCTLNQLIGQVSKFFFLSLRVMKLMFLTNLFDQNIYTFKHLYISARNSIQSFSNVLKWIILYYCGTKVMYNCGAACTVPHLPP